MVKEYSLRKDGDTKLTPHFRVREFACPTIDKILIDETLPPLLEALREKVGSHRVIITSGYRDADYDRRQGGSGRGFHVDGRAADINVWKEENGTERRLHGSELCCALQDMGATGIGWIAGHAVHVDMRATPYWFDEQKNNASIGNDWYGYDFGAAANRLKPTRTMPAPPLKPRWDYRVDAAVRELQKLLGVTADGKAGPDTFKAASVLTVKSGNRSLTVRWVQSRLNALGYPCGTVDGIAGTRTMAAIRDFQHAFGRPTGILRGDDWYFLLR